jgi:predicted Na+-dependent transporter
MERQDMEQLSIITEARAAVADRLITPWWYHPILGLLLAGYLVGLSLGSNAVRVITAVLFAIGCGLLVRAYRHLTGVWVSGVDAGRPIRWARALAAVVLACFTASWGIAYWTELTWPVWCLAAVVFVSTVILGRRFDTAQREQLRANE